MRSVCDAAWSIMYHRGQSFPSVQASEEARVAMVGRVTSAVVAGQRSHTVLLAIALGDDEAER